ncbi:hypothetical protein [Haloarcula halophila]|uniref:hypothetical protein n=1 Tax=Haloarcula TaxID=2237 RepID=UPI003010431F
MVCPDCERPYPSPSTACVSKRYQIDGATYDPILWGEEARFRTYEQQVTTLETQVLTGGRGRLSKADVRQQLDRFVATTDPETWNNRSCPACGVEQGEYHHPTRNALPVADSRCSVPVRSTSRS